MEITNPREFLDYWEKVRQRTLRVIACIPPEKYDWRYTEGKFSFADIIRHLATIERYMYAENVRFKPSLYPGHGKELADGPENVNGAILRTPTPTKIEVNALSEYFTLI